MTDRETYIVENSEDAMELVRLGSLTKKQADRAVQIADENFEEWKHLGVVERLDLACDLVDLEMNTRA